MLNTGNRSRVGSKSKSAFHFWYKLDVEEGQRGPRPNVASVGLRFTDEKI